MARTLADQCQGFRLRGFVLLLSVLVEEPHPRRLSNDVYTHAHTHTHIYRTRMYVYRGAQIARILFASGIALALAESSLRLRLHGSSVCCT